MLTTPQASTEASSTGQPAIVGLPADKKAIVLSESDLGPTWAPKVLLFLPSLWPELIPQVWEKIERMAPTHLVDDHIVIFRLIRLGSQKFLPGNMGEPKHTAR